MCRQLPSLAVCLELPRWESRRDDGDDTGNAEDEDGDHDDQDGR